LKLALIFIEFLENSLGYDHWVSGMLERLTVLGIMMMLIMMMLIMMMIMTQVTDNAMVL